MMITSSISIGTAIQGGLAAIGGIIIAFLGGWDTALEFLLIFMLIDIISGVFLALIGKSRNSPNGYYKSGVFGKGVLKKVLILVIVALSYAADMVLGMDCLRDMTVLFFFLGECISIIENAECAGVPIPNKLRRVLEVYHEDVNTKEDKENLKDVLPKSFKPSDRISESKMEEPSESPSEPSERTFPRP